MAGITRIHIKSDSKYLEERLKIAHDFEEQANDVYRNLFYNLEFPLADGEEVIEVPKGDRFARYDWQEGIDIILEFKYGDGKATLQEKVLTYGEKTTLTVEENKASGAKGAWYYCTAQYYSVFYVVDKTKPQLGFRDWIVVNFAALKLRRYGWQIQDGIERGETFRFIDFSKINSDCIIGSKFKGSGAF
jgi:hypothetical protein